MVLLFLSPPTEGDCTGLIAWHIDEGRFGGTDLKDLNVVLKFTIHFASK